MIDRSDLPRISEILPRLDVPIGRRGRTQCPIHRGSNHQAFKYDDSKGFWWCFRCGFGGDVIDLVKHYASTDFKGALEWLGVENGEPAIPDPAKYRKRQSEAELWHCLIEHQRSLREEFRLRGQIEHYATQKLCQDPESRLGWNLLEVAYSGRPLTAVEHELDTLLELIPREAYETDRGAL